MLFFRGIIYLCLAYLKCLKHSYMEQVDMFIFSLHLLKTYVTCDSSWRPHSRWHPSFLHVFPCILDLPMCSLDLACSYFFRTSYNLPHLELVFQVTKEDSSLCCKVLQSVKHSFLDGTSSSNWHSVWNLTKMYSHVITFLQEFYISKL